MVDTAQAPAMSSMPRLVFPQGTLFLCGACRRILPIRELRADAVVGPRIAIHECSACAERYRVADAMLVDGLLPRSRAE